MALHGQAGAGLSSVNSEGEKGGGRVEEAVAEVIGDMRRLPLGHTGLFLSVAKAGACLINQTEMSTDTVEVPDTTPAIRIPLTWIS